MRSDKLWSRLKQKPSVTTTCPRNTSEPGKQRQPSRSHRSDGKRHVVHDPHNRRVDGFCQTSLMNETSSDDDSYSNHSLQKSNSDTESRLHNPFPPEPSLRGEFADTSLGEDTDDSMNESMFLPCIYQPRSPPVTPPRRTIEKSLACPPWKSMPNIHVMLLSCEHRVFEIVKLNGVSSMPKTVPEILAQSQGMAEDDRLAFQVYTGLIYDRKLYGVEDSVTFASKPCGSLLEKSTSYSRQNSRDLILVIPKDYEAQEVIRIVQALWNHPAMVVWRELNT